MGKRAYQLEFEVRRASEEDVDGIVNFLYPDYFNETVFKDLTYSEENTRNLVSNYIRTMFSLVAVHEGEVVGFSAAGMAKTFFTQSIGEIVFFAIRKDFRGSALARGLAGDILYMLEMSGAEVIYANSASGIDSKTDALWANLWSKFGFLQVGIMMIRG